MDITVPPPQVGDWVVRQAWGRTALIGLACAMVALAALVTPYLVFAEEERPWVATVAGWGGGFFLGIFAYLYLQTSRKARGAGGWVLQMRGERLFINLRSHMNDHFPADQPTVLAITSQNVRWMRVVDQQGMCAHVEDNTFRNDPIRRCYLDIALEDSVGDLREALKAESQRYGPGVLGSRSRSHQSALRLFSDGILRVAWSDETNDLTPDVREARRRLSLRFRFLEDYQEQESAITTLTREGQEERLLTMAIRGDEMEAGNIAQLLYSMNTTQAARLIRELQDKE